MKKLNNYLITTIVLLLSVSILFMGCTQGELPEPTVTEETTPIEVIDVSDIEPVAKDEEVTVGDITWKILKVEDIGTQLDYESGYTYYARIGRFVSMEFEVTNNSDESVVLYDLNVVDDEGRVFSICLPAYGYFTSAEACAVRELIPDNKYKFVAPFDVSKDSEGLMLEASDLGNPPAEKTYIDLGI